MQRTTKGLTLAVAIVVILLNLLLLVKENYIFSFLRPFGPVRTSTNTYQFEKGQTAFESNIPSNEGQNTFLFFVKTK